MKTKCRRKAVIVQIMNYLGLPYTVPIITVQSVAS